jgi:putative transposase
MTDNQGQSEDIWGGHTTWLIHDGNKKFCASFKDMLDDSGVKRMPLPPRSPWLNAFAKRWVQSVKTEALSRMIL